MFHPQKSDAHATNPVRGSYLGAPSQVKYLGITLDKRRLIFGPQLKATVKKCRLRLIQLRWLNNRRSTLPLRCKRAVYVHCVLPIWLYGVQIWGIAAKSNYRRIQVLQNRVLRQITNCPWYVRGSTLHKDLHIHSVEDQINRHTSRYCDRLLRHRSLLARGLLPARPLRRLKRVGLAKRMAH